MLNKQAFFDFKNVFMMFIFIQRMGYYYNLEDGHELHSFDGLTFLNVKGDISICSPDLPFKCLSVSP